MRDRIRIDEENFKQRRAAPAMAMSIALNGNAMCVDAKLEQFDGNEIFMHTIHIRTAYPFGTYPMFKNESDGKH